MFAGGRKVYIPTADEFIKMLRDLKAENPEVAALRQQLIERNKEIGKLLGKLDAIAGIIITK